LAHDASANVRRELRNTRRVVRKFLKQHGDDAPDDLDADDADDQGDGADQDDAEQPPAQLKQTQRILGRLHAHAKSEASYLHDALPGLDHAGVAADLGRYAAKRVKGRMGHLEDLLGKHHNGMSMDEVHRSLKAEDGLGDTDDDQDQDDQGPVGDTPVSPDDDVRDLPLGTQKQLRRVLLAALALRQKSALARPGERPVDVEVCVACGGTKQCQNCGGRGRAAGQTCDVCNGSRKCWYCKGTGRAPSGPVKPPPALGAPDPTRKSKALTPELGALDRQRIKESVRHLGMLHRHAKAESDWLDGELPNIDHPEAGADLQKYKDMHVDSRMGHLEGILGRHHPDADMDDVVKGLEAEAGSPGADVATGEAGLVGRGDVAPNTMEQAETYEPRGGGAGPSAADMIPGDMSNPAADEVLDRYHTQTPAGQESNYEKYLRGRVRGEDFHGWAERNHVQAGYTPSEIRRKVWLYDPRLYERR
jgi:hypothetical protein